MTAGFDSTRVVIEFFIGLASVFVVAAKLAFPTPPIEIHNEAQKATFAPKMYSPSLSFDPKVMRLSIFQQFAFTGRSCAPHLPSAASRLPSPSTAGLFLPATPSLKVLCA
jgi:hypothetical protein